MPQTRLALALGVHQAPCKAFASLTRIAYPHSLGAALALFAISGVEKFKNVMAVTDFLALFWQKEHHQTKGHRHEKDRGNRGSGFHHHSRHGTDNGLWVWFCPIRFGLLTSLIASLVLSACPDNSPVGAIFYVSRWPFSSVG